MCEKFKKVEDGMNARTMYYIPKKDVNNISTKIIDGDIIGITSTVDGLDCNHTGIAIHKNGELHFLHAPFPVRTYRLQKNRFGNIWRKSKKILES